MIELYVTVAENINRPRHFGDKQRFEPVATKLMNSIDWAVLHATTSNIHDKPNIPILPQGAD